MEFCSRIEPDRGVERLREMGDSPARLSALLGQKLKSNGTDGSEIGSNFTDGKDEKLVWRDL